MNTRKLGNSDLMITPIGFGAWAVGGPWQFGWGEQRDDDSIAAIHRVQELGINWIDTAAVYGLGHSEEVVARALRDWAGKRPYVFTKCGMVWNEKGEVGYSLRAESIRRECKASLRRLNVDIIDLYQIHWPADDLAETLEGWATMAELQKKGKVHWIGVCNFSVQELQKAKEIAPVTSLQPPYSLIRRDIEKYLLPFCQRENRSEEHTSELQSRFDLVCRLLLEKKKQKTNHGVHGLSVGLHRTLGSNGLASVLASTLSRAVRVSLQPRSASVLVSLIVVGLVFDR